MTCKLNRILVIIIGLLGMPAFASTIKKMDLRELVSVSDAIAQGTVESVESRWEKQSIYTYTSIRVDEAMKGGPRRALLIRQAGGQIGALHAHVPGMPQFKVGDQVKATLLESVAVAVSKSSAAPDAGAPSAKTPRPG